MKYTQFLVFETGRECNLAHHHEACPSGTADRYGNLDTSKPITDEEIEDCAFEAYKTHGFQGNIAWHYYNEPMLQWDRIQGLMIQIGRRVPDVKFTLWTNGTLLTQETPGLHFLDQIWISNYQHRTWDWLEFADPKIVNRVVVMPGHLDGRRKRAGVVSREQCLRPYSELIIDHYGNGHLCCMDWKGECPLGNIRKPWSFRDVVETFQYERWFAAQGPVADGDRRSPLPPRVCESCPGHTSHIADLVPPVQQTTLEDEPWKVNQL